MGEERERAGGKDGERSSQRGNDTGRVREEREGGWERGRERG